MIANLPSSSEVDGLTGTKLHSVEDWKRTLSGVDYRWVFSEDTKINSEDIKRKAHLTYAQHTAMENRLAARDSLTSALNDYFLVK
jgi:hypothetical protein